MNRDIDLAKKLVAGANIKFGKKYCEGCQIKYDGKFHKLKDCGFENDNGGYLDIEFAPALLLDGWNEPESIYHMFENDLSGFMDCEVKTQ